jgi:acyl-CoA thioesterase-1
MTDTPQPRPKVVIVFGDSITEAKDLPESEQDQGWVSVVERKSEGRLRMVNEGKGGRLTSALAEFEEMLQRSAKPDLFIIALGANDARDTTCTAVSGAFANLKRMIQRIRELHGEDFPVLIVAPTNIRKDCLGPSRPIANEREENLVAMESAFQVLAAEMSCHFISSYNSLPPASLAADGVHPDRAGHAAMAALLGPAIVLAVPEIEA